MQKQARHAVSVFHEMQAGSKKCGGDDRQAKANSLEKNAAVTRPDNRRYVVKDAVNVAVRTLFHDSHRMNHRHSGM